MSTRRRGLAALFGGGGSGGGGGGNRDSHAPQIVPSPPATPRPTGAVGAQAAQSGIPAQPPSEERVMTSEELQQSVESLENVLKTMDQVRDMTNRCNAALREHARGLRMYAVGINMLSTRDERGQPRVNVGEDRVSERLLAHCANYYDRLAEAQELLVMPSYNES